MSKCVQLKDLVFLIVTVPKIFKIRQKLTEIWPKNELKKSICLFFNSNLLVKNPKIFLKLNPLGL